VIVNPVTLTGRLVLCDAEVLSQRHHHRPATAATRTRCPRLLSPRQRGPISANPSRAPSAVVFSTSGGLILFVQTATPLSINESAITDPINSTFTVTDSHGGTTRPR